LIDRAAIQTSGVKVEGPGFRIYLFGALARPSSSSRNGLWKEETEEEDTVHREQGSERDHAKAYD